MPTFQEFLQDASGSPYHAVQACINLILEPRGWKPGMNQKRGYLTRCDSSIFAWAISEDFDPKTGRIVILMSHTDSPCLRLRQRSKEQVEGYDLLGTETYGGGLWHTWFDRSLGLAGRVTVATSDNSLQEKLVKFDHPIAVIPNLCIHLQTQAERQAGFKPNPETELRPLFLTRKEKPSIEEDKTSSKTSAPILPALEEIVLKQLGTPDHRLLGWDLCFYDCEPPSILQGVGIVAPGLDNKTSVFATMMALTETPPAGNSNMLVLAAAFDNEEIGSQTAAGADSNLLPNLVSDLLAEAAGGNSAPSLSSAASRTLVLSCDAGHAVHPYYCGKHQSQNKAVLGGGVCLKFNANKRYATSHDGADLLKHIADKDVPLQAYSVRNDCPCGSTVGPYASAHLAASYTIDVGVPLLAMHSARETGHLEDVDSLKRLCSSIINNSWTFPQAVFCNANM